MYNNELYHYGVKGMKWGVRKKQLPTSSMRKNVDSAKAEYKSVKKAYNKSFNKAYNRSLAAYSPSKKQRQRNDERWEKAYDDAERLRSAKSNYKKAKKEYRNNPEVQAARKAKMKKAAKIGAAAAGTALAVYGGYKLSKYINDTNTKYHMENAEKFVKSFDKSYSSNVEKMTSRIADQRAMVEGAHRIGVKPRHSMSEYNRYTQELADYKKYAKRAKFKATRRELDRIDTDSVANKIRNTYEYTKKKRR